MGVIVLGSANVDIVVFVQDLPKPGETILARESHRFLGGKGANQAIAAVRAGAQTRFIFAVGKDGEGDFILSGLDRFGVDTRDVAVLADVATGQALITVSGAGENTIVVAAGANDALVYAAPEHETGGIWLAQLEVSVTQVERFLHDAKSRGGTTVLNAAPARPEAAALFPLVDILIVNETELASFAGSAPDADQAAMAEAARSLFTRPDQMVVITLGAQGALLVDADGAEHVAGRKAEVVDTTGAGDCFCGVLAAALSEGASIADAARRANVAASIAVTRKGAGSSMPTKAEVTAAFETD